MPELETQSNKLEQTQTLEKPETTRELSPQQKHFCQLYAQTGNAAQAARDAGYTEESSDSHIYTLLRKPQVKEYLNNLYKEASMTAEEAIKAISDIARGVQDAAILENGSIDVTALKKAGLHHLIKKSTPTKNGMSIEFYSRLDALDKIARAHGIYSDTINLNASMAQAPMDVSKLTLEECEQLEKLMLKARSSAPSALPIVTNS
jgi:phage terminase small subunit